jgi:putative ABC transport system permease protein
MLTSDLISTAFRGISTNKSRSALTMLGIIIGVASVVLMVSIGKSFQNYILSQIEAIGTNTIDVFPVGLERQGGNTQSLTLEDYEAVRRLPSVESVAPVILVTKQVSYGKEDVSPMVMGTYGEIFKNYGLKLASGRLMDQSDVDGARNVAVLSYTTAKDLFGDLNPIGKKVKIGEGSFTVVGTLEKQGSLLMSDLDKPVYVPFTAARSLMGQKYLTYMTLKSIGDPAIAALDITLLLRDRHNIDNPENDPDKDDFRARSAEQITTIVGSVTLGLTIFLSLVAAISLLVGGIGIMNIMLVSVTERTREIGLRKAVGARRRDILLQFLLEAVALTFTGGAVGILLGLLMGFGLATLANAILGQFSFALSIPSIFLAVVMAVGTGLLFGIYPAKRAAQLDPIEALRFE